MQRTLRSIGRQGLHTMALGAFALLGARSAQAQWGNNNGQQNAQLLFQWQGNVDRETEFDIGSRGIDVRGVQGNESRGRFVSRSGVPRGSGTLYVQRVTGRGNVDVVRQPGSSSGSGAVRILDKSGGAGYYDIRVYWQPNGTYSSNGESDRGGNDRGGYGQGRDSDRNRDGRYDRDQNVARNRDGRVVYDRRGNVVYERRGDTVVVRDRNGNVQFDRDGDPVYRRTDDNNNNNRSRRRS